MASTSPQRIRLFFTVLALAAFISNWLWEMAQMRAYTEMASTQWAASLIPCTWASVGDVVFTFLIYGIGALATGEANWGTIRRWNVLAVAAVLGAVFASAYEWKSQGSGRWSYTNEMPIVPILGVGFWPFLQLIVTVPAAFWIAQWYAAKHPG